MELVLSGFARVENGRLFLVSDASRIGDERLKNVFMKIQKSGKPQKIDHWVYLLGMRSNHLSKSIILSLIEKGVIQEKGKMYHWGMPSCDETPRPVQTKFVLKRQVRDALFCERNPDRHLTALLGLMEASEMLDHLFTKDEIIAARKQVKGMRKDERLGELFIELLGLTQFAIAYAFAATVSV